MSYVVYRRAVLVCLLLSSLILVACGAPAGPELKDSFVLDVRDAEINAAQPAALDIQGVAALINDPDARFGYGFRFRRSGDSISWQLQNVAPGTYRVSVSARADLYKGAPELTLQIDAQRTRQAFANETYKGLDYGTFDLKKNQALNLRFENDLWEGSPDKDRNITVDTLVLERVEDGASTPVSPSPAEPEPTPGFESHKAHSAYAFVDSVGVNTHLHYTNTVYGNFDALIKPKLLALGIKHIRDGIYTYDAASRNSFYYARLRDLGEGGVQATLTSEFGQDNSKLDDIYSWLDGRVAGFEGVNEPDLDGTSNWIVKTKAAQKALFETVNADAATKDVPVLGPSVIWSVSKIGDLSSYLDYGNAHPYPGGRMPAWTAYGNSQESTFEHAAKLSGDKPIMATEAGYHNALNTSDTHPGTSERSAAAYMPRLLLKHFELGVPRTFLYEFIDLRADASKSKRDRHFGLLRNDGSEKPSYRALKNLLGILADDRSHTPGSLSYTLTGSDDLHSLLFQKSDGSFYLALWRSVTNFNTESQKDQTVSAETASLKLASRPSTLNVHSFNTDGNVSVSERSAQSLDVDLEDRVVIVEITP